MPIPPPFDPANHHWGLWRLNTAKPTVAQGSSGQAVGYLQGALKWSSGLGNCAPLPGPWVFSIVTTAALRQFQGFWGLPQSGVCDAATWGLIDAVNVWRGYP